MDNPKAISFKCAHCNHLIGKDRGFHMESVSLILIVKTTFRCPKCFTKLYWFPDRERLHRSKKKQSTPAL
jgi:hypothetical protein